MTTPTAAYTAKDSEERLWTLSMLTMEDIKGSEKVLCGGRGRSWNNDNRRSQDFSSRPPGTRTSATELMVANRRPG